MCVCVFMGGVSGRRELCVLILFVRIETVNNMYVVDSVKPYNAHTHRPQKPTHVSLLNACLCMYCVNIVADITDGSCLWSCVVYFTFVSVYVCVFGLRLNRNAGPCSQLVCDNVNVSSSKMHLFR